MVDPEGIRAEIESLNSEQATVRLNDGRLISLPRSYLLAQTDGSFRVEFSLSRFLQNGLMVIPVIEEQLDIDKREVQRTVRISKTVEARDVEVNEALRSESIDIERVPVNRYIDSPLPVREENGTTIISLVEEVLVVEKRWLLREEIRISRREAIEPFNEVYTLRREDVHVERDGEDVVS